jgi:hypothetical protein
MTPQRIGGCGHDRHVDGKAEVCRDGDSEDGQQGNQQPAAGPQQ